MKKNRRGKNNPFWGLRHSSESKRKIGLARLEERNPQWKGDNVGYASLHQWVHGRIPKPNNCQHCQVRPPLDLANKSGEYKRDLSDWWWVCRRCHMVLDGRMANLKHDKTGWYQKCKYCGREFWVVPWDWNNGQGRYCSKACSNRGRLSVSSLQNSNGIRV